MRLSLSLSLSELSSLTLSAAQQVNEVEGDDGKELDKGEYGSTRGFNNKKKKIREKKVQKRRTRKKKGKIKLNLK
jgi:hypothetical protein